MCPLGNVQKLRAALSLVGFASVVRDNEAAKIHVVLDHKDLRPFGRLCDVVEIFTDHNILSLTQVYAREQNGRNAEETEHIHRHEHRKKRGAYRSMLPLFKG
jgi:microsomal dipeptidase-like Zn-dependent dipeptidase